MVTIRVSAHQKEDGDVHAGEGDTDGEEDDLHCAGLEGVPLEEGRRVVLDLVLLLVLVLDLPLLRLQVEDSTPLGMVERGRAVEGAQKERDEKDARDSLQAQPPTQGTES